MFAQSGLGYGRAALAPSRRGVVLKIVGEAKDSFPFCLCADDFALSAGVSRGILEALGAGRLSATSAMTNRPSWPIAARQVKQFEDKADIGLHLNLTLGNPLGPMPKFAASGQFPHLHQLVKAALLRQLPAVEIGQEISRQIDEFCEHFGAPPAFIDGHHHVHVLPQVRAQLFACLEAKGLSGKVWLRDSSDRLSRVLRRGVRELARSLGGAWLAKNFAREAAAHGFLTNDGFAGWSGGRPNLDCAVIFPRYLRAPGERHLVMCHPGYCDEELRAVDSLTFPREIELRFLLSSAFIQMLDRSGARLARLSNIAVEERT